MQAPPGVQTFDAEKSKAAAASNFTVSVHGGPKTGKSHFAFNSERPLYVVYLDTNPNVHTHMIKSSKAYGDEVYHKIISMGDYKDLTEQRAQEILDEIEAFRDWAIANAYARVLEGKHGGTFITDGMVYFKGYCEKAIMGESVTLGWRPKKGGDSFSTYEYAKPNMAVWEYMTSFTGKPLDAIFVWEGRPIYKDVIDTKGKVQSKKTDAWKSTRPDRIPFGVSAEIEMLKALERIDPTNNASPLITVPKLRIIINSENLGLDHMVIPAKTFADFKRMLLEPTVGDFEELAKAVPAAAIIRATDSGFPLAEVVADAGDDDDD